MKGIRATVAILAIGAMTLHAQAAIRASVSGQVGHASEFEFQGEPRLSDAVIAAQVDRDAYVVGAAWLRPGLVETQTRLKAGLTFELSLIGRYAGSRRHGDRLAELARRLHDWVDGMPVTGRQTVRTLEPHALQVSLPDNFLVKDGDRLNYPQRPSTVSVVGAVEQSCDLPQVAMMDARGYLARCVASRFADTDRVFVIQPDGHVFEQGIAAWNLSPPLAVAPGAVLYVPIDMRAINEEADEKFNREMADFIATQPLGLSRGTP